MNLGASLVRCRELLRRSWSRGLQIAVAAGALAGAIAASAQPAVLRVDLHDTLQAERSFVFKRALDRAGKEGFTAVLVDLSTPGGTGAAADDMILAMRGQDRRCASLCRRPRRAP